MGAAASEFLTHEVDISKGYKDNYGDNIHEAASNGDYYRVKRCLKKGADPNEKSFDEDDRHNHEDTVLICAVRGSIKNGGTGRHLKVCKLIHDWGGDPSQRNHLGETCISVACQKGYLNIVKWLIEIGIDLNVPNKVGTLPIELALKKKHSKIIELLTENKVKIYFPPKKYILAVNKNLDLKLAINNLVEYPEIKKILINLFRIQRLNWCDSVKSKKEMRHKLLAHEKKIKMIECRRQKAVLHSKKKVEQRMLMKEKKINVEIENNLKQFICQEDSKKKNLAQHRLFCSGRWIKIIKKNGLASEWKYVANDKTKIYNEQLDIEILNESRLTINKLLERNKRYSQLRNIQSALDQSIETYSSNFKEFNSLEWLNSETLRPISAPVFSD